MAVLQAAGVSLFVVAFGRHLTESTGSIRRAGQWSVFVASVLLVGQFAIEAARMADDWAGVANPALQRLAMASPGGAVLVARIVGLGLVSLGLRFHVSHGWELSVPGAVLIGGSFALMGHTFEHPLRALLGPLLIVHVLIVAFWFGALLPLYLVTTREAEPRAARTIEAFSVLATWLVPLIAAAGLAMTLVLVRHLDVFVTPYGALLIGKAAGFVTLMGFAALNKWRLGPRIATNEHAGLSFRRSLATEYALIATVLTATAVMTMLFSPDPS